MRIVAASEDVASDIKMRTAAIASVAAEAAESCANSCARST
jgi:hypothetical protein